MKIVQRILLVIISVVFLVSAAGKLMATPEVLSMLETFNLSGYHLALGAIDMIIVLSLILQKTRYIGVMVASGYLGGAIALMLSTGSLPIMPGIVLLLVMVVGKIQLWRSRGACECGTCTCDPKPIEQQ